MTDTPMTPERLPFFQPGHLYAARMGWPEGRERFRFLCESVTTDARTGQLVAYGQHGRLRTADSQWIWTPNPRTHDDWKGGAWTDITDWTSLLAEVDRLRKALSDATGQVAELEDDLGKAAAEAAALRQRLHEAAMARVWTNEDGKKFVFADDLKGPLLGKAAPVDEAAELAEGQAELEAMRRERPAPCRVPDSPDCTCPSPERLLARDELKRVLRGHLFGGGAP